jgi:imidazolonepropionase-like amidohydrolase
MRGAAQDSSSATLEPGRPADLVVLDKDPRKSLDHLAAVKRAFVAGREIVP